MTQKPGRLLVTFPKSWADVAGLSIQEILGDSDEDQESQ